MESLSTGIYEDFMGRILHVLVWIRMRKIGVEDTAVAMLRSGFYGEDISLEHEGGMTCRNLTA